MKKKKLLLIAPLMFHYHQILIDELAKQYQVFFFPDQPKDPFTALKRKLHKTFSERYYKHLFQQVKNERFDVFLCINGKGITREFIEKLRALADRGNSHCLADLLHQRCAEFASALSAPL